MSFEEEFDSQLREKFIVALFLLSCFGVSFAWLLTRWPKRDDVSEPFFCVILSAVSLGFALSSLFVVPVDQALQSFPQAVVWLGINSARFSGSLASVSLLGCTFSILLLNPFALLWGETPDTSWGSFWTTVLELALLLVMVFCMAMLYFTRATVTEALVDPTKVLTKLSSLLMHGPGCLMFLYFGPVGIAKAIVVSLGSFVPWRTTYSTEDARRLKDELMTMKDWTNNRKGRSAHPADIDDLERELEVVEKALSGHPLPKNVQAIIMTFISCGLTVAVTFRVLLPNSLARTLFGSHSPAFSVLIPSAFLIVCVKAFLGYSRIEQFIHRPVEDSSELNRIGARRRSRERMAASD